MIASCVAGRAVAVNDADVAEVNPAALKVIV